MQNIEFNIYLGNHDLKGRFTLLDFTEWLYCTLKELNLNVSISRTLYSNKINIIFENFTKPLNEIIKSNQIPYGIICTETPTKKTFNNIDTFGMKYRRRQFDKMIENATFIWTTWGYSEYFDYSSKKFGYMKLGYSPFLKKRRNKNNFFKKKQIDFLFSGSENSFRKKLLNSIGMKFNLKKNFSIGNQNKYMQLLNQSKFFLCFQQNENWPCLPTTKIMSALHADCIPILLEPKKDSSDLKNYFCTSKINTIDTDFKIFLKSYSDLKDKLLSSYKSECMSKNIMKKLVDNINNSILCCKLELKEKKFQIKFNEFSKRHNILDKIFISYYWKNFFKKIFKILNIHL